MSRVVIGSGAAAAALALMAWSGAAGAVTCVNTADDAYMNLTTSGSATVTCWDAGDQPNPGSLPVSESGPGVFLDGVLNLPAGLTTLAAKSDGGNSDFFNILSGSLTSGLSGSFMVGASGRIALLFKSGRGQNTPSWWLYQVMGLAPGEVISWSILGDGPINGLSHVSAYVPLPPALWLFGSGLIALFGFSRRRSGKLETAAA